MPDCSCKRAYEESDAEDEDEDDDDISTDGHDDDEDDDQDVDTDEMDEGEDEDEKEVEADKSTDSDVCPAKCDKHTTPVPESSKLAAPPSPFTPQPPASAPLYRAPFPSLRIPVSPSSQDGLSPKPSPMASPYSGAYSATSPSFPYDMAMARMKGQWDGSSQPSSKMVRYRSVVTHTITYTPKINAVPKNKRRRVE